MEELREIVYAPGCRPDGQEAPSESGKLGRAAMERFAMSPALFVENRGQFEDASIRYLHHGRGALVALTDSGPVIQLRRPGATRGMGILPMVFKHGRDARATRRMGILPMDSGSAEAPFREAFALKQDAPAEFLPVHPVHPVHNTPPRSISAPGRPSQIRHVSVRFPGAHETTPGGARRSESVYHYQKGAPEHWRENVPTFEEVVYPGLYDGIDLKVWGRRDHLKYEFHVAPGADHEQVRVRYEGIRGLSLDADGALLIDLGEGWEPLRDDAPYIYQDIGGERVELPGRFRLLDAYTYTFELLAPRHPAYPLILDPRVEWGTYLGGSEYDEGRGIAVDGDGNVYVTGWTSSSGWVSGGLDTTHNGGTDAFVVKIQDGAGEGEGDPCASEYHTADQDQNNRVDLPELLRVIQFHNSGGFRCADDPASTEDGYVPGPWVHQGCCPHDSDYDGGADLLALRGVEACLAPTNHVLGYLLVWNDVQASLHRRICVLCALA